MIYTFRKLSALLKLFFQLFMSNFKYMFSIRQNLRLKNKINRKKSYKTLLIPADQVIYL